MKCMIDLKPVNVMQATKDVHERYLTFKPLTRDTLSWG